MSYSRMSGGEETRVYVLRSKQKNTDKLRMNILTGDVKLSCDVHPGLEDCLPKFKKKEEKKDSSLYSAVIL